MNFGIIIKSLIDGILSLLHYFSYILIPILIAIIIIVIIYIFFVFKLKLVDRIQKHDRPIYFKYKNIEYVLYVPFSEVKTVKNMGMLKRIFIQFPKMLAYDFLTRDPNAFREYGIHMVVGEQGSGKTVTTVYLLEKWKKIYPRAEIYTNMNYKNEDASLKHWKQLIDRKNGIYGCINVIDEIKTWWSNRDSKDVPVEILGEISQQRKQRKAIIGTVQVFNELAKPFRSQTHYVYIPRTYFGCLTVVKVSKAKWYNEEKDEFKKYCGIFFFPHTLELRNAYDTYKTIQKYKDTDFTVSSTIKATEERARQVEVVAVAKGKKLSTR